MRLLLQGIRRAQHLGGQGRFKAAGVEQHPAPGVALFRTQARPVLHHHQRRAQAGDEGQIEGVVAGHQNDVAGRQPRAQFERHVARHALAPLHVRIGHGQPDAEQHRQQGQRGQPRLGGAAPVHHSVPTQRGQHRQRRQGRKDVADQLGLRNAEKQQDHGQPDPAQRDPWIFGGARCHGAPRTQPRQTFQPGEHAPRRQQQGHANQIEPPGLCVVESRAEVARELLHAEEVGQRAGELAPDHHEPGQRHPKKDHQPTHPRQAPDPTPLARPAHPRQHHQRRQRHADQPLGQHAQRAGQKSHTSPAGVRRLPIGKRKRARKRPDRHADPGRHTHVVVDVGRADQHCPAGTEHERRAPGHRGAQQLAHHDEAEPHHQQAQQHARQAHHPGMNAEHRHAGRLQPVREWRLVKERQAVQARDQPVARHQHPAADVGVAPLVRDRQRAGRRQRQQQDRERAEPQPGTARVQRAPRAACPSFGGARFHRLGAHCLPCLTHRFERVTGRRWTGRTSAPGRGRSRCTAPHRPGRRSRTGTARWSRWHPCPGRHRPWPGSAGHPARRRRGA